jgi:hypothetical protein
MVSVHAGTFLLGDDRTLSKRLLTVALCFCLLASVTAVVGHLLEPAVRGVASYGSLAMLAVLVPVTIWASYRNQGLVVCWFLCFAPVFGAVSNGMVGLTGAYPTVPEWLLLGVQFGAPAGFAVGTAAFVLGFLARLVVDAFGERDARPV